METKKTGNVLLVSMIIISVLLAFLLAAMFLFPFLSARSKLFDVADEFEQMDGSDIITVSDPMYKEDIISRGVTVILEENEREIVSEQTLNFISKAKYSDIVDDITGSWDIEIALRTDDGVYKIYFTEDSFYVAKGTKKYIFKVSASDGQAYADFYAYLEDIISEAQ